MEMFGTENRTIDKDRDVKRKNRGKNWWNNFIDFEIDENHVPN